MTATFLVCYCNYHLIFAMKYWTLSLKIESLMQREQQITKCLSKIISGLFWSLESIMFCFYLISILMVYGAINTEKYLLLQYLISIIYDLVGFFSLLFVCDAFRRLKKCLEHDHVGISTKQIVLHLLVFTVSLIALSMFGKLILSLRTGLNIQNYSKKTEDLLIEADITVLLVSVSILPIMLIMNALLNKTIRDNQD